jgi:hypothetical protein
VSNESQRLARLCGSRGALALADRIDPGRAPRQTMSRSPGSAARRCGLPRLRWRHPAAAVRRKSDGLPTYAKVEGFAPSGRNSPIEACMVRENAVA